MSKSENVSRGRHLVPTGYLYGERIPLGCEIQIHNVVSVKYITVLEKCREVLGIGVCVSSRDESHRLSVTVLE